MNTITHIRNEEYQAGDIFASETYANFYMLAFDTAERSFALVDLRTGIQATLSYHSPNSAVTTEFKAIFLGRDAKLTIDVTR